MKHTLYIFIFLMFASCRSQQEQSATQEDPTQQTQIGITFLDSTAAVKQILQDKYDGFFTSLSVVEMAIQMRSELRYDDKPTALESYKAMLATEVYSFAPAEEAVLAEAFTKAKRVLTSINPKLWPVNIDLIKTRTNHYGPDVYYTREDAIIIPDNVFASKRTAEQILPVMLHEIFHILSRYDPAFRKATYALIDFAPHGKTLVLPEMVDRKRLTNPDGVTTDYAVMLQDGNGGEQLALPFLTSSQPYFSKNIPSFFAYLNFDLYPLVEQQDGSLMLGADSKGKTTLSSELQNNYFTHIADNTQYVIHPEEVMADNFMLAVQSFESGDYKSYSKEGRMLVDELLGLLKNY